MRLSKVFKVCFVVAGLLVSYSFPGFSENMFKVRSAEKNSKFLIQLDRIEKQIKSNFPKTEFRIVDFLIPNKDEIFLHTEDGLFYARQKRNRLLVNQIFVRSSGQIEPQFSFSTQLGKFIIFKNEEMKNGIITDW